MPFSMSRAKISIIFSLCILLIPQKSFTGTLSRLALSNPDVRVCYTNSSEEMSKIDKRLNIKYGSLMSKSEFEGCVKHLEDQSAEFNIFCNNVPTYYILVPASKGNLMQELITINTIFAKWKSNRVKHAIWAPVIFVLWPEILIENNTFVKEISSLVFSKPTLTEIFLLDNQVYIVTTSKLKLSDSEYGVKDTAEALSQTRWDIWDIYSVNSKSSVGVITSTISYAGNGALEMIFSFMDHMGCTSFIARRNFHKLPLRTIGVSKKNKINKSSLDYERINKTSIRFVSGLAVNLLWGLRDSLNFTVIAHVTHKHARIDAQGKMTGIGKQIFDNEIDLSIALHTLVGWRQKHVEFLQPIFIEQLVAFFQQPPSSVVRNIFLWPFQTSVWLSLLFFLLLFLISIILINQVRKIITTTGNKYVTVMQVDCDSEHTHSELGEILILVVGITTLQGWGKIPLSRATRIIFIFGMLFFYTLYLCYSGSIVSALTLKVTPVTEFSHFLKYGYSFVGSENTLSYYKTVPEKIETSKVVQDLEKNHLSPNETIQKILADDSRVSSIINIEDHYYYAKAMNVSRKEICKLSTVYFGPRTAITGMFIQKGSPFKQFLNTKTILLFERGLGRVFLTRYRASLPNPCQGAFSDKQGIETSFEELTFEDSKLMFIVILAGIFLCKGVLVIEIVLQKIKNQ